MIEWLAAHWDGITIGGGLIYTGASLWAHVRARRADTAIEVNKQHRELWIYYEERPELHGLKDMARDMAANPLAPEERRFAGFLFNHLAVTVRASRAGVLAQPERLREDIRALLAYPALGYAWRDAAKFHDRRFAAFVESARRA